jgi:hypothetical protein
MLEEPILSEIRKRAASEGRTMQAVTNDLLRAGLSRPSATGYYLRLRGWKADLQPGVDILDRDKLFDLMDGR